MVKLINKRGVLLIGAVFIMIALALLGIVGATMLATHTRTSFDAAKSTQALYTAESGLQQAIYKIRKDPAYRNNPAQFSNNLQGGNYTVSIAKNGNHYVVTANAIVAGAVQRSLQQAVDYTESPTPAFDYAISILNDSTPWEITGNVNISGDPNNPNASTVYFNNNLTIDGNAQITNGKVYAPSVTHGGNAQYQVAPSAPNPLPTFPTLDTSSYDNSIAAAEAQATANLSVGGNSKFYLNGQTLYYKQVTIGSNAQVFGSGTIVATQAVSVSGNASFKNANVTIITKDNFSLTGNALLNSGGALVYSRKNVTVSGNAQINGNILAPNSAYSATLGGGGNAKITGMVYADSVSFGGNCQITGSIVANSYNGPSMGGNADINWQRPVSMPPGMQNLGSVTLSNWQESY